jgi:hypothetical protein
VAPSQRHSIAPGKNPKLQAGVNLQGWRPSSVPPPFSCRKRDRSAYVGFSSATLRCRPRNSWTAISFSIDRSFRIAAGLRCLPPRLSRIARQPSLLSDTTATVTPLVSPTSSLILSKIIQLKSTLDRRFLRIKIPHILAMAESYRDVPARTNQVKVEGWATARRGCGKLARVKCGRGWPASRS